jgi:ketosteroid isomerase-like protein
MPATTAETIVDVADRLFAAIEKSSTAGVDRLWSTDIAVWRVGARRQRQGSRAARDRLVHRLVHHRDHTASLRDPDRRVFDGGFVQQHVLYATGHAGQSISMRVCIVIRLDITGLIDRIDEYFDPPEIAPLID